MFALAFQLNGAGLELIVRESSKFSIFYFSNLNFLLDYEKLKVDFSIASEGDPLAYLKNPSDMKAVTWAISFRYCPKYGLYVGVGDRYINYSPFVLHLEEWENNVFKGLFVNYRNDRFKLAFDGFLGLHAEDTYPVRFEGEYLKTDIGFINKYYINRIKTEFPSIWGCFKFEKSWGQSLILHFIFLHENYCLEKRFDVFNSYYFFKNYIFELLVGYKTKNFHFGFCPLFMIKNYSKYNGYGDFYGPGLHKLVFDYYNTAYIPSGELTLGAGRFLNFPVLNSWMELIFRYMEKGFIPVHADNARIKYNRGENFLDDVFTEEKGFILKFEQPLFLNIKTGIDYSYFVSTVSGKQFVQTRYFLKGTPFLGLVFFVAFCSEEGFLEDYGEVGNLKGIIANLEFSPLKWLVVKLWFVQNKWHIKNNNELMIKINLRG